MSASLALNMHFWGTKAEIHRTHSHSHALAAFNIRLLNISLYVVAGLSVIGFWPQSPIP